MPRAGPDVLGNALLAKMEARFDGRTLTGKHLEVKIENSTRRAKTSQSAQSTAERQRTGSTGFK